MFPRVLWYYALATKSSHFSKDELKRLQDQKLRRIINQAYNNVPFYHRRLHSKGITPVQIHGVDDLKSIPTLTRQEIKDNFTNDIIYQNMNSHRFLTKSTSGTTGPPLKVLWNVKCCNTAMALRLRRCNWVGVGFTDKVAHVIYAGPTEEPSSNIRPITVTKLINVAFGPFDTQWPSFRTKTLGIKIAIGDVTKGILKFKPKFIFSRPSYLRRLGYLLRDKRLNIQGIICVGETLSKSCRKELKDLFQTEVYDTYGALELGSLASECVKQSGMHLNSDYFIFEFLRNGEPVSAGESGEVVVTSLYNDMMPLIRYKIGDIAVPDDWDSCECGLTLPRLREIHGRLSDGMILNDQIRIPPGAIVDYLENVMGLRDFQLTQKDRYNVLVKLKPQYDRPNVKIALLTYLRSLLGQDLTIDIDFWYDSQMPVKYRPVISNIVN
jgi:phenylacetate-CoA ligase